MYWVQEYGQATGANRGNWKMFHCDYKSDIALLPTNTQLGQQITGNDTFDKTTNALATYGDQVLCLEDSSVFELRWEPDDWKEL